MTMTRSETLYQRAVELIPGGVNSPVRAFGNVGGTPRFISHGRGSRLWDVDGVEYIDAVGSWGPLILGHAHEGVLSAVEASLRKGTSFGAPTEQEVRLAELILNRYPGCEQVRLVNSGTEATMSAIRTARGATDRDFIIKFEGNYHGHADSLLVAAGSGALTTGVPSSAGVTEGTAATTLVAGYNDLESVEKLFDQYPEQIAAVILEPVAGNMGLIPPATGFLEGLREITAENGALLIIDEVMTGFRLAAGGAIERYQIDADLVCWGKIIGGGLPVGAYGGKAHIMSHVSPLGSVYQAGTLSGNPLATAAGIATLEIIAETPGFYATLEHLSDQLETGLREGAAEAGVDVTINRVGSMLTVFFCGVGVTDFDSACKTNGSQFNAWFHSLLSRGVYWPPSPFEAAFLSYAHSTSDIESMIETARAAFKDASTAT
ncbi:MAG: glutamate-1-semialdehyde 2,1-aminomutase [Trueperaceae bacterium]|nr:MAG: glutamate-1-semialdehyde 2,1-aminomutase [Trueperaceae bacterium]